MDDLQKYMLNETFFKQSSINELVSASASVSASVSVSVSESINKSKKPDNKQTKPAEFQYPSFLKKQMESVNDNHFYNM